MLSREEIAKRCLLAMEREIPKWMEWSYPGKWKGKQKIDFEKKMAKKGTKMTKKKGIIDEWHDAAIELADKLGIIDHDFTEEDLEPIKKALKAAAEKEDNKE